MKKIHFVTLSRSDYATLKPVAQAAIKDSAFDVKIIAGGSHLLKRFGKTIDEFVNDGLNVAHKVKFLKEGDDSDADMAAAYARAVQGFVKLWKKHAPDMVFIVGDRWEMLAVATAASMLRIPVAHHSGGDITQGSADNQTRYVLTTLSHLHFTALEVHARRLAHMGEEEWRITAVGEPALNVLPDMAKSAPDIRAKLGLKPDEPFKLATFHPTSYDDKAQDEQIEIFIKALEMTEGAVLLTAPNPDPGSGSFYSRLSVFAAHNPRIRLVESLGAKNYYAAMKQAKMMIGNSSSGLWEAPSFSLPVINIGRRQDGRARGINVIDAGFDLAEIKAAIVKARSPDFRASLENCVNPYVKLSGIDDILSVLKKNTPREKLLAKHFVDPLGVDA